MYGGVRGRRLGASSYSIYGGAAKGTAKKVGQLLLDLSTIPHYIVNGYL
jgi:hypothetical protein